MLCNIRMEVYIVHLIDSTYYWRKISHYLKHNGKYMSVCSYVPYVASFSGLSIFDYPFGIL